MRILPPQVRRLLSLLGRWETIRGAPLSLFTCAADAVRGRAVFLYIDVEPARVPVVARLVPGTDRTLCVHASALVDDGGSGATLTHVPSGCGVCRAATFDEAMGFGTRLWLGLGDQGRDLFRTCRKREFVYFLSTHDHRWTQAVARGAQATLEG